MQTGAQYGLRLLWLSLLLLPLTYLEGRVVASFSEAAICFVTLGLDFVVVTFFELALLIMDFSLIAIVMTSKTSQILFVVTG